MEDELEEAVRQATEQEEKAADREIREQMLTALGQLNQRLEKLKEQQSEVSSAAGSFLRVGSSPSRQGP